MPIIWKVQFSLPVLAQMVAGKVKDPVTFAGAVSSTYSACIKTGFPIAPAPPVPFTLGKTPLLKAAIAVGLGVPMIKGLRKTLKFNKRLMSKSMSKIDKQISMQAAELSSELSSVKKKYDAEVKSVVEDLEAGDFTAEFISSAPPQNSPHITTNMGQFVHVEVGDPCTKTYVIPLQDVSFETFNKWKTSGIDQVAIDAIKASVKRTQNKNIEMFDEVTNSAKDALSEQLEDVLERKKENFNISKTFSLLSLILFVKKPTLLTTVKTLASILKALIKSFTAPITDITSKISELNTLKSGLKSSNTSDVNVQKKMIAAQLEGLGDDKKAAIKELAAIPKLAKKIFKINVPLLLKSPKIEPEKRIKEVNQLLAKRMNMISQNISKLNNEKSAIFNDLSVVNEARNAIAKAMASAANNSSSTLDSNAKIKLELGKVLKCTCISIEDQEKMLNLDTFTDESIGIKARRLVGKVDSKGKRDILSIDALKDEEQKAFDDLKKELSKNKTFNADDLWDFKKPQRLFDAALGAGLVAYWLGGTIPSAGVATVIFPGLPPVALGLKTNFKSLPKLMTSLELIFQAHAFTIAGVYVTPAGVSLPWVGYF
jgi:hypothetical protein